MAKGVTSTFISYSREDSEFALRLAKSLRSSGATVWLDKLDISPGLHWDSAVEKALEDCPCVLVILSPSSVTNKNVMDEVSFAVDEGKSVIPALYRDCRIPLRLRRVQYIDFRTEYESGLRELVKALGVEERTAPESSNPEPAADATGEAPQGIEPDPVPQHPPAPVAPSNVSQPLRIDDVEQVTAEKGPRWIFRLRRRWLNIAVAAVAAVAIPLTIYWYRHRLEAQLPTRPEVASNQTRGENGNPPSTASRGSAGNTPGGETTKPLGGAPTVLPSPPRDDAKVELASIAVEEKLNSTDGLRYVSIPPGVFDMGCTPLDALVACGPDEKPAHRVTISKGFWMSRTEVTVAAYRKFAQATGQEVPYKGNAPAGTHDRDDDHPITNVSWNDAAAYCSWAGARLPSEAEWEYAARAGSREARYGQLWNIAWSTVSGGTHAVAQKAPNNFGLYDMLGNVYEWCSDWYGAKYYQQSGNTIDPKGPEKGEYKVARGGSWYSYPHASRASSRWYHSDRSHELGFRCVREAIP